MRWYVEHRYEMHRYHSLTMVRLEEQWQIGPETRSVYAYPEPVATTARRSDTLAGLVRPLLRADWLFIDVDSGAKFVHMVQDRLTPYTYEKWTMGSSDRAHFHIPLAKPLISPYVIDSQRQWLGNLLGHNCKIDWSIYIKTGQIRMPGTINHKRWAVKTLEHRNFGELVNIPIIIPDPTSLDRLEPSADRRSDYVRLLTRAEGRTGRHRYIWVLCKYAVQLGLGVDEVVANVVQWNKRFASTPLPHNEVVEHTTRTYRGMLCGQS